ncbi:hypothetical protein [Nostoc sp. 'Lobaria pulmonaria (5183) cyanobiont']|uniref:hypothetical protein n=1 Tax=Nostoc sp. 'Lobaria pulmonaria (5183) cyanobiont' TaxID=1618022 RepID=UPI000CF31C96|nr:hypothetical protein [Nostoc sp. 'Lobaria pulmonaria (5183) cyanobiont']AVH71588.1 hypothetical protein NLP_2998 [Nostoc sp. 'Lobaria pulmonaria (5183) cyanobiont']
MSIASDNNLLWIPPDISDLLTVSVDGQADDSTVQGMLIVNGAASQWLTGAIDDYTYFELLNHFGIDPLGFVGEVEEHMALLMR